MNFKSILATFLLVISLGINAMDNNEPIISGGHYTQKYVNEQIYKGGIFNSNEEINSIIQIPALQGNEKSNFRFVSWFMRSMNSILEFYNRNERKIYFSNNERDLYFQGLIDCLFNKINSDKEFIIDIQLALHFTAAKFGVIFDTLEKNDFKNSILSKVQRSDLMSEFRKKIQDMVYELNEKKATAIEIQRDKDGFLQPLPVTKSKNDSQSKQSERDNKEQKNSPAKTDDEVEAQVLLKELKETKAIALEAQQPVLDTQNMASKKRKAQSQIQTSKKVTKPSFEFHNGSEGYGFYCLNCGKNAKYSLDSDGNLLEPKNHICKQ